MDIVAAHVPGRMDAFRRADEVARLHVYQRAGLVAFDLNLVDVKQMLGLGEAAQAFHYTLREFRARERLLASRAE